MNTSITAAELKFALAAKQPPLVIDVRRPPAFRAAPDMATGALRRDPDAVAEWAKELPRAASIVTYCVHGHEVSQGAAQALRDVGISARYLEGGIEEGWRAAGGDLMAKPKDASTRWVTRERPKIDRIACPWLIARFIDPEAEFLYVPPKEVLRAAQERGADSLRRFGRALLARWRAVQLRHFPEDLPALERSCARAARGDRARADTARLDFAPQAAGLLAISLGLSRNFRDDHEMLGHGMVMYDALYAWCKGGQEESHTWNVTA